MNLPKQLQNPEFRFVLLQPKSKNPCPGEGANISNHDCLDATKWIKQGGNVGIVCGVKRLRVLDLDAHNTDGEDAFLKRALRARELFGDTFVVETGSGGYHFYFFSDYKQNKKFANEAGEMRSRGWYVVCPPSVHPDTGKEYAGLRDIPIAEVADDTVKKLVKEFGGTTTKDDSMVPAPWTKPTRVIPDRVDLLIKGGADQHTGNTWRWEIVKELHGRGFTKDEIMELVLTFNKNSRPPVSERQVAYHVEYLLDHADEYLSEKVDEEWLKNQNYGAKAEKKKGFNFVDGEEFMTMEIEQPKFQVEKLVLERSTSILAGYQSTFKSHLAAYIALCLINGIPLFNRFACKKLRVWYINEEMHRGYFQNILKRIAKGIGAEVNKNLIITNFENKKIDNKEDNKLYHEFIKKHKIDLVIFDSIRECFTAPENSADEITRMMQEYIRPIIEDTGCSFFFIMHKGKSGAGTQGRQSVDLIRGSSVFRNYCDSIILADRVRKTERVTIKHEKIRATKEADDFNMIWVFEKDKIIPKVLTAEEEERMLIDECKIEIMTYISKRGVEEFESGTAFNEVFEKQYSRDTYWKALGELKEEERLIKIKRGTYITDEAKINDFT